MERQRWEESERRSQEVRSEKRKSGKNEDAGAQKGRKVAIHYVFPMICGSRGLGRRRVRSHLAKWEMRKSTPSWREAHFQVEMYKAHHSPTTFGSSNVEKVHTGVARSKFPSQKCQSTRGLDHFVTFRCRRKCTLTNYLPTYLPTYLNN